MASFTVGEAVRTRAEVGAGHTRLPRYLQQRTGVVTAVLGCFPLPDHVSAHREDLSSAMLYSVRFASSEVWGAASGDVIYADLFEPYLEPVK